MISYALLEPLKFQQKINYNPIYHGNLFVEPRAINEGTDNTHHAG